MRCFYENTMIVANSVTKSWHSSFNYRKAIVRINNIISHNDIIFEIEYSLIPSRSSGDTQYRVMYYNDNILSSLPQCLNPLNNDICMYPLHFMKIHFVEWSLSTINKFDKLQKEINRLNLRKCSVEREFIKQYDELINNDKDFHLYEKMIKDIMHSENNND